MPDKIGSISSQWGKIGSKKSPGTPDNQSIDTLESQSSEQVEAKAPDRLDHQDINEQSYLEPSDSVVQTSEVLNNELTKPQKDQEIELPDYQWTSNSEDEDTDVLNNLPTSSTGDKTTRNLVGRTARGRTSQSSNGSNKRSTRVRVVQYTREVKPERIRQTVYLYPDVLRWIKRRIAETDEEISDVGNYTAELCMWLEEKHPEIIARFERQRRK